MVEDIRKILNSACRGDKEAFGQLVRMYQRRVYLIAFRMTGNHEDANDVAQEAFIRAFRGISSFQGQSDFFTWLYRIVINVSLNHLRSRRRRPVVSLDDVILPAELQEKTKDDPGRSLELKQMVKEIGEVLDELPDSMRATVVMVVFDGMPYKDVASVLECSEGTVAWRIFEARKRMLIRLGKYLSSSEEN
ncbi:MAG: sigma-70 family RNA polymerase sigma factor [Pseudomonadota bacterium]